MNIIYVALGGAIGSVMRYLMSVFIGHHFGNEFPYSTLTVNVTGSFAMGLLIGWLARTLPVNAGDLRLFVAVGVLGGFTTFSSFSLDAISMMENGQIMGMLVYVFSSVLLAFFGLMGGLYLTRVVI